MHLKKLVQLNLKGCKSLKALPAKMEMSSLKVLNLSGCSKLNTAPDFGNCMRHLSELSLDGTAVAELPSSLGCLVGLVHLHLMNCEYLVCLPDTMHKLKSLKVLNVSGCLKLSSLPECLLELKYLEELNASNTAIEELPSFLGYLENLKSIPFEKFGFNYCNLLAESIPDGFCGLPFLRDLDLSGNNFVNLPSDISKHSTLESLCLNSCKKLQSLPELPLSIRKIDASNCASLVTSTFHPSSECNIFASPVQWHLPREQKSLLKGLSFPMKPFDMLITGNEIPSWFAPQKSSFFAEIPYLHHYPPIEWVGCAVCFLLVSDANPPRMCHHKITCSFGTRTLLESSEVVPDEYDWAYDWSDEPWRISRNLPPMEPKQPHVYILFLPYSLSEEFLDRSKSHGFELMSR
ncbi:hypothetical protein PIB30_023621 [Stylosanthes scabra]|uniref:Disease resistance R13L4/SHOC-2-like LRR domain-containing protein n=1 Tax=Stylosanthes scabra TaxID=79078 RepID=A0ABU6QA29_9FABA|nr:hypothetical protein [Stylosanthes scabra]